MNWARGYYTQGPEKLGEVMDAIRKAIENCDALQGFQFVHSLSGMKTPIKERGEGHRNLGGGAVCVTEER